MSETFRSNVEEIIKPNGCDVILCKEYESSGFKGLYNCTKCQADRICAALKERVEGMPQIPRRYLRGDGYWGYDFSEEREAGAEKQLEACKKYMLEGLDV